MPPPTQKDLYRSNRARLQAPWNQDPAVDAFEREWIARRLGELPHIALPASLAELRTALAQQIAAEQSAAQPEADYVAEQMQPDEFRILVQEFAIDGLTEAQAFYYVLPRLPLEAQMPLLRIMIDEFGSGNLKRAHTTLYVNLLRELGMPTELAFYLDKAGASSFEFVNLFFWLALRADDASYFAGALTYLETAIPAFFECYAQACRRLNVTAHAYYTEHQHIDGFHAVEGQKLLATMHATGTLNVVKACQGARLMSHVTDVAFRDAVAKARQYGKSLEPVAVE
ncbi:iron-containing redox enzyme family protein [Burkholderia sp. Bp8998]|uniref:iron-containing redox enzyme family protein n=1 Tax=Burkholderia sp. Bp8998 TaxID=2184557 RepID=UPI000F5A6A77|nr:iron-containing redox enzyme family protein [Burkholderia sp. Bp8998]RQS06924.1 iron-containing redox enzyme family protein [Burkholderia sp. Bp8998]